MISGNIQADSIAKLADVMDDYVRLTGKDASQALRKAGREVDFALYQEFRQQPPRPLKGSILAAARARGWTININSASYVTGYVAAQNMLGGIGGYRTGYFRVSEGNGRIVAELVHAGPLGRGTPKPAGTKRLNLGALAMIRALNLREKAGAGGYMSAEFLTFKKLTSTTDQAVFVAKDKQQIGDVAVATGAGGDAQRITISGRVENSGSIGAKYGLTDKAVARGAESYRTDMYAYVLKRARDTLSKVGAS